MLKAIVAAGVCLSMIGSSLAQTSTAAITRLETRIPPQALGSALKQFAKLDHIHVLYLTADVRDLRTLGASGYLTADETLTRLLTGTGLKYRYLDASAVSIVPARTAGVAPAQTAAHASAGHPSIARPNSKNGPIPTGADPPDSQTHLQDRKEAAPLSQVVITGTHLTGVRAIASPVSIYSSGYIDSTGAGSVGEFLSDLPENFSETTEMSETALPGGPGAALGSQVGAVGFDIHGLGVQSTLVLVNGSRLAGGNSEGNFVDVSLLPLSAIQRIDIVKDSASAVYGSDAVGGVVNIITRQGFSGAETTVRFGKVTQGGRAETTASELVGSSWSGGAAVLSYEYGDESPLAAASRSFSAQVPSPFSLLPEQTRHSLYGSFTQSLPANLLLNGFLLYGHRNMEDSYFFGNNSVLDSNAVNSYTAELGLERDFKAGDEIRASVEYSMNDSHHMSFLGSQSIPPQYTPYGDVDGKSKLAALNLDYDGGLALPGWRVIRYALGGQARKEKLSYTDYLAQSLYQPDRSVLSEYIEVHFPIVRTVDLTVAYRHEHYTDFGSTDNPKIGMQWTPNTSVSVSGTYSTAFRAPALYDKDPVPSAGLYIALPDPRGVGGAGTCGLPPPSQVPCTPVLILYGGNASLKPETAKSWTATLAFHPVPLRGLKASLSFYDVKYYNRINQLDSALADPTVILEDEAELGNTVVRRGLPNQEIQVIAGSAGQNLFNSGVDPAAVTTLVDDRSLNVSELSTRGVDFDVAYARGAGPAVVASEVSGTRILQYRTQFTTESSAINALNTAYNPLSLRLKLHESVTLGGMSGSIFANYTGSYTNTFVTPVMQVASWLTFDASVRYSVSIDDSDARSAQFTIGCLNVADRNPPFVSNTYYQLNFDGANASPLGRFVYAEARVVL